MDASAEPLRRPRTVAWLVAGVFFLQLLDGTIIATSLPQMAASFGTDAVALGTGFTAYMLAMAAFIPPAGWLADRFGARRLLVLAILAFAAASLACGLAQTLPQFTAARIAQGAAAAMMAPIGRILVLRNARKADIVRVISTITWPALFAPVVGPVIGSWITTRLGWEWNFYLNLPLGLVAAGLFLALVPAEPPRRSPRCDSAGFALVTASIVLLVGGLELFSHRVGDLYAAIAVAIGALLAVPAVGHMRRAHAPLFDLTVLEYRSFTLSTLSAGSLSRIGVNATPFLLPLMFQVAFGLDPIETGALVLVYFLGNLAMKAVTTPVMRRFGFRNVLIVNGVLAGASIAAFALVTAETQRPLLYALLFVAGLTRSMQFTAANTLAFVEVGDRHRTTAATLSTMTQQLAMTLGIALAVAAIRISQSLRGDAAGDASGLADIHFAFVVMGALVVFSALRFVALPPGTGDEITGFRRRDAARTGPR